MNGFFAKIGRHIAESVVTPDLVGNAMADELERLAREPRYAAVALDILAMARLARAPSDRPKAPQGLTKPWLNSEDGGRT